VYALLYAVITNDSREWTSFYPLPVGLATLCCRCCGCRCCCSRSNSSGCRLAMLG